MIPTSTIKFFNFPNMTPSYEHTKYFSDTTEQEGWFDNQTSTELKNYAVVKKHTGQIKVAGVYSEWYKYNYMTFKNADFDNKVFYAFILSADYINPKTTLITFSIDLMQTWGIGLSFNDCWIDREHVSSDEYFEHLEDEGFTNTDPYYSDWSQIMPYISEIDMYEKETDNNKIIKGNPNNNLWMGERCIMVIVTGSLLKAIADIKDTTWTGFGITGFRNFPYMYKLYRQNGSYLGNPDVTLDYTSTDLYKDLMTNTALSSDIVGVYDFYNMTGDENGDENGYFNCVWYPINGNRNYKNKKMYQYPYNYLQVTHDGGVDSFLFENFKYVFQGIESKKDEVIFHYQQPVQVNPYISLTPRFYRETTSCNLDYCMYSEGFNTNANSIQGFIGGTIHEMKSQNFEHDMGSIINKNITDAINALPIVTGGLGGIANKALNMSTNWGKEAEKNSRKASHFYKNLDTEDKEKQIAQMQEGNKAFMRERIAKSMDEQGGNRPVENLSEALGRTAETVAGAIGNKPIISNTQRGASYWGEYGTNLQIKRVNFRDEIMTRIDNYFTMYGYSTKRLGKPELATRESFNYIKMSTVNYANQTYATYRTGEVLEGLKAILTNGITFWHSDDIGNYDQDNSIRKETTDG